MFQVGLKPEFFNPDCRENPVAVAKRLRIVTESRNYDGREAQAIRSALFSFTIGFGFPFVTAFGLVIVGWESVECSPDFIPNRHIV